MGRRSSKSRRLSRGLADFNVFTLVIIMNKPPLHKVVLRAALKTPLGQTLRARALRNKLHDAAHTHDRKAIKKMREGDPHLSRLFNMSDSEHRSPEAARLREIRAQLEKEVEAHKNNAARLRARAKRVGNGGFSKGQK